MEDDCDEGRLIGEVGGWLVVGVLFGWEIVVVMLILYDD